LVKSGRTGLPHQAVNLLLTFFAKKLTREGDSFLHLTAGAAQQAVHKRQIRSICHLDEDETPPHPDA
jgi:hypothetical protein